MTGVKKINGTTPVWPANRDQGRSHHPAGEQSDWQDAELERKEHSDEGAVEKTQDKLPPEGQGGNIDEFV